MYTVYIGHATQDEHGKAKGGEAGNQTGKELNIKPWYLNTKGWVVLRPKDREIAKLIAQDAVAACNNLNIGYDQGERNTLYSAASKVGFDCARVKTPCECDCSSLVRVCLAYAGIKVKNFNTASEVDILMATDKFEKLTDPKYTEQDHYLMVGDILVTKTKGHTAIVLNDGDMIAPIIEPVPDPEPKPKPESKKYVLVIGGSVRVRTGGSILNKCIGIAHRGDTYEYLGSDESSGWYEILYKDQIGYISNKPKYTQLIDQIKMGY